MGSHPQPVLFIHGAFGSAHHLGRWSRAFEKAGFECHVPSLPGHDPVDPRALAGLSLSDYERVLEKVRSRLSAPPVLIGHSMGGLLAQRLAATGRCSALVCLAAVPPGVLTPQLRTLPYLAPFVPRILAGRPVYPTDAAIRYLAFHDLPGDEQDELVRSLGPESGKACRGMYFGTMRVDAARVTCPVLCVSGAQDRIVSRRIARRIARRYGAVHEVLEDRGHWLVSRAGFARVARLVLDWLEEP